MIPLNMKSLPLSFGKKKVEQRKPVSAPSSGGRSVQTRRTGQGDQTNMKNFYFLLEKRM
jgi:hypothetical protein